MCGGLSFQAEQLRSGRGHAAKVPEEHGGAEIMGITDGARSQRGERFGEILGGL